MKIKKIINQNRRDFTAIYVCHCGHEQEGSGYDDKHFHTFVIPTIVCNKCGDIAKDDYIPQQPKYPEGMQI